VANRGLAVSREKGSQPSDRSLFLVAMTPTRTPAAPALLSVIDEPARISRLIAVGATGAARDSQSAPIWGRGCRARRLAVRLCNRSLGGGGFATPRRAKASALGAVIFQECSSQFRDGRSAQYAPGRRVARRRFSTALTFTSASSAPIWSSMRGRVTASGARERSSGPGLKGPRRTKFAGHRRGAGRPIALRRCAALRGAGHDHCDDLVRRSTIAAAAAHSGTGIGVSWNCRSAAGARPDRLAPRMVSRCSP
jgi:hypothetical protein